MFSRYLMVLAVTMLLVAGVCASAFAQTEDDIATIHEVYNQLTVAIATGDVERWLSLYTEDAVVMTPGAPAMVGMEEIRPPTEDVVVLFDLELSYTAVDEVGIPGDWAFVRSRFQFSMTPKEGGETMTSPGSELDILKRQADGSWKIYIESWNYDVAPPAAKMAGSSRAPGRAKMTQGDDADAMYREMCDLYTLACTTGDLDLYVSNYTDDGVQMPPDAPPLIGSEQIRASMAMWFDLFSFDEEPIYPQDAEITGDWAFGRCEYSAVLTPKEGGPSTTFHGKDLDIFKRQADGSWKYYMSNWKA